MSTATPDLLATIVAASRRASAGREASRPAASLAERPAGREGTAAFRRALETAPAPRVIAECKRRSPSRGILRSDYDPAAHARAYADAGATAISVLTEPTFFDGSLAHLDQVRRAVTLPVLRKDFIVTEYQVRESAALGADAILLIVAALSTPELQSLLSVARAVGLEALVEVHTREELERALDCGAAVVGVNSRNLRTLAVDLHVVERLAASIPPHVVAVAESGIRSHDDLLRLGVLGYRAFLVGERLIADPDPGAALRALRAS